MLSHVRVRAVVVVGVMAMAGACAAPAHGPAVQGRAELSPPALSTPALTPPATSLYADPTQPPPGPPLPEPVAIPKDPYAPEPVVELGSIEIPAIGLKQRLFEGVTLNNIDRGPSHWTGSALPGQLGNAVFAGHRTSNTEPFRHIDALVPGDRVIFTVRGVRWTYRVTGHLIVSPADSWIADQTPDYTATLYACHPLGSTAQRYVVRLALVR
jgi:sortase A